MQVKQFYLEILSPIVITSLKGDENTVHTEKFITGTTLIGALAKQYIQEKQLKDKAHEDNFFYNWFLSGKLSFSNIYPIAKDERDTECFYKPTPLCFQHVKNNEVDYTNILINKEKGKTYKAEDKFSVISDKIYFESNLTKYNFHHERNYNTGVTRKGKIFTYQSLEPGYILGGSISGEADILNSLLKWIGQEKTLYVGRSKGSQYGKVKFRVKDDAFDTQELEIDTNEFILFFESHCIFYNENGFPTIDKKVIENQLVNLFEGCNIQIKDLILKQESIDGFHNAWKLRKLTDISIKAGSCFYIQFNTEDKEKVLEKLKELSVTGIGERKGEGFGKFQIIDTYTIRLSAYEPKKEENKKSKVKPLSIYSQTSFQTNNSTIQKLIESVYKTELKKLVYKKVQSDIDRLKGKIEKASFVSHILSFVNKDTCKFEYRSKDHNKEKKQFKELHRALQRNVDRLSIDKIFLFDYFTEIHTQLNPDSLIVKESSIEHLKNDYPFLKNLSLEKELNLIYFKTFVSLLRKRIKEGNKP